jgi:tetratricopeptide (TPR) repeat protein
VTLEAIQEAIDNVRAAWRWAVEAARVQDIKDAEAGLAYFYEIQGWFQEGRGAFTAAIARLEEDLRRSDDGETRLVLGQTLTRNSLFHGYLGMQQEALALQQKGVEVLRRAGATNELGFALVILGRLLANTGQFSEGVERCQEGLTMLRETGSCWEIATALNTLGNVFNRQGMRDQAAHHYEEGAHGFEALGDKRGLAVAYTNLGNIAYYRGDYAASEKWHRKSLKIKRQISDRRGVAVSLHNLGEVAYRRQRYAEAQRLFEESLELSRETDYRLCAAESLNLLGDTACAQEAYSRARRHYRASLNISERTDNVNQIATSLSRLGRVSAALGEIERSRGYFERALQLPVAPPWVPNTLIDLLDLLIAQEAYREALEIAALVREHPASRTEAQEQAELFITRLRSHLPPDEAGAVIQRGRQRDLEQMVRRVQAYLGR